MVHCTDPHSFDARCAHRVLWYVTIALPVHACHAAVYTGGCEISACGFEEGARHPVQPDRTISVAMIC